MATRRWPRRLTPASFPCAWKGAAHMEVVRQFNVTGAPTTLIFSPDGRELHRFSGFSPPADYLKELEKYG